MIGFYVQLKEVRKTDPDSCTAHPSIATQMLELELYKPSAPEALRGCIGVKKG